MVTHCVHALALTQTLRLLRLSQARQLGLLLRPHARVQAILLADCKLVDTQSCAFKHTCVTTFTAYDHARAYDYLANVCSKHVNVLTFCRNQPSSAASPGRGFGSSATLVSSWPAWPSPFFCLRARADCGAAHLSPLRALQGPCRASEAAPCKPPKGRFLVPPPSRFAVTQAQHAKHKRWSDTRTLSAVYVKAHSLATMSLPFSVLGFLLPPPSQGSRRWPQTPPSSVGTNYDRLLKRCRDT